MARKKVTVSLSAREVALVLDALDSHVYWQLSDPQYRNNGYVSAPGSDDAENADEIAEVERLLEKLTTFGWPARAMTRPASDRPPRSR